MAIEKFNTVSSDYLFTFDDCLEHFRFLPIPCVSTALSFSYVLYGYTEAWYCKQYGPRLDCSLRSSLIRFIVFASMVKIDHEIISTVILLPSAESFMKGCCQLQAKVCARLLVNCLFKLAQEKSVVR